EKYCEAPPSGWCCVDKVVIPATPEECKKKGGVWFPTKAEAEKYCEAPPSGWCCVDKVVIPATPEECKKKGGVWFPTKAEAEKYCRAGAGLPDLIIKEISLNRKCQVVVTVANAGPGMVPDDVWAVHTPGSSSVYLYVNGKKWGGRTIWGFDPGKTLQPPGGVARCVSRLTVGAEAEITAVIDHTAQVAETDEGNNKMVKKLRCAPK
ncbi:MAG: hypothetical protein JXO51_10215, partial [Candidatus Aminicenantes bacterium]|nr:hypothetical protein [Candidatus Aminicenantes bacterium]